VGTRVLFPQAVAGLDLLPNALRARGVAVDVVPASETRAVRFLPSLPAFDVATFGSPSALHAFVAGHGLSPLQRAPTVVIGPTTAAAAGALGLTPHVASSPTVDAIIDVIGTALSSKGAS
jgi:uroporphyrinogen-III synthase